MIIWEDGRHKNVNQETTKMDKKAGEKEDLHGKKAVLSRKIK